ncbi:histidine phosphatase family protein [Leptospira sp. GIMC2001]|uniref:histidine phosphatase family protein n=1 Tax=Leptospira sp. GIMC2001 TaxID=1513297 RepID=UPI00234BA3EF|nr:histidine phosphatase family protein [Leptospira sp. GIMC2001]WCL51152.1 histidine phosphatase family protein [Leptospira sp. GIMC2001]
MNLLCLRHPPLPEIWNGRFLGQMDPRSIAFSPSDSFIEKVKLFDPELIVSSDLLRCSEMAEAIKSHLDPTIPLIFKQELREISFGRWESKSHSDLAVDEDDKELYSSFLNNFPNEPAPEGEAIPDFQDRIAKTIHAIHSENLDRVLIVSHAGVIRSIASQVLNASLDVSFRMVLDYLSASRFQIEKDFTMFQSWNESF